MRCKQCGEIILAGMGICGKCGAYNNVSQRKSEGADRVATDHVAKLKGLAKSVPFILGCLLMTAGLLGGMVFDFSWLGILDAAFVAVHIVALWMLVYDAVFSPASHTKTLTALTMLMVSVILGIILACLTFGSILIFFWFYIMDAFIFMLFVPLLGGWGYLLFKYYFWALLQMVNSIKHRVTTGKYASLEGLGPFLVLSYIGIGLSIFTSIVDLSSAFSGNNTSLTSMFTLDVATGALVPHGLAASQEAATSPFNFTWGTLFVIANGAGRILCLLTLKKYE